MHVIQQLIKISLKVFIQQSYIFWKDVLLTNSVIGSMTAQSATELIIISTHYSLFENIWSNYYHNQNFLEKSSSVSSKMEPITVSSELVYFKKFRTDLYEEILIQFQKTLYVQVHYRKLWSQFTHPARTHLNCEFYAMFGMLTQWESIEKFLHYLR